MSKEQQISVTLAAGDGLTVTVAAEIPAPAVAVGGSTFSSDLTKNLTKEQLRDWRKNKGLTQGQVADALGVKKPAITRWELGTNPVPTYLWLALIGLETVGLESK